MKNLTTYDELQEDKTKLENDIKALLDAFLKVHGNFELSITALTNDEYSGVDIKFKE